MPRKGREGMGVKNFLVFCHYEQIKCICRTVQTILPYYTWNLCDLFMNFVALIFVFCPGFILNLFLISTGYSVQFSSVTQSCPTLCNPMNCSMPGLPVHHQLLKFTQTHTHWVGDNIQPSRPLSSPSPPALNLSQHKGLLKWVSSPHQVAKVLDFQLQHQSLQWTPRTDLL